MKKLSHLRRLGSRCAFTLIEMVVSLSIISIIFLAMGSVMVLAGKAVPTKNDAATLTLGASDIIRQIATELQTAKTLKTFSVSGATTLEFTVSDRDNDSIDETIKYTWSGVAGQPLLRQYNGGNRVAVLPHAYEFVLTYDTKTVPQPDLLVESAEVALSSRATAVSALGYAVNMSNWIGQYFQPSLPVDAVSWKVTRALVMAQSSGPKNGETLIQLRPPVPGGVLPSSTVLEQVSMWEASLPTSYQWQEFVFSTVQNLVPGKGLCLVLKWNFAMGMSAATVQTDGNGPGGMFSTSDRGINWNAQTSKSMLHFVYGTYTTAVPQPPVFLLKSVALTLNPGDTPASRVRTSVVTFNQPQMP